MILKSVFGHGGPYTLSKKGLIIMEFESLVQEMRRMREKLDTIAEAVIGDPADSNKPGMLIRIDRLERSHRFMKVCGGILVSGMVTMVTALALRYI